MSRTNLERRRDNPTARERILERITEVLACPDCKLAITRPLHEENGSLECPQCGRAMQRRGDQIIAGGFAPEVFEADWLNRIKERTKHLLDVRFVSS